MTERLGVEDGNSQLLKLKKDFTINIKKTPIR